MKILIVWVFPSNIRLFLFLAGSGVTIPDWDFLGHTIVTNNYIRLTADEQSQSGAIWNNVVGI